MLYRYRMGINALDIKQVHICRILSFAPQSLDEITDKLHARFPKKDKALLESEVESFLQDLEKEGVIVSGNTDADLAQKDKL